MDITRACRDLNELNPIVRELAQKLIEECKKQGMNINVSETYRSPERQDYLYAQGRTRPGKIITHVRGSSQSSYHQWRLAFDVYNNVPGAEYDTTIINRVGKIGQELGLEWGGAWSKFRDTPHFQYTFGLSIQDLKNGKKPPNTSSISNSKPTQSVIVDKVYEAAINTLIEKKIITTTDAWLPEPNIKYAEILISRIVSRITATEDYRTQIQVLEEKKVIGNPEVWLDKKYTAIDVKWLIKKAIQIL